MSERVRGNVGPHWYTTKNQLFYIHQKTLESFPKTKGLFYFVCPDCGRENGTRDGTRMCTVNLDVIGRT